MAAVSCPKCTREYEAAVKELEEAEDCVSAAESYERKAGNFGTWYNNDAINARGDAARRVGSARDWKNAAGQRCIAYGMRTICPHTPEAEAAAAAARAAADAKAREPPPPMRLNELLKDYHAAVIALENATGTHAYFKAAIVSRLQGLGVTDKQMTERFLARDLDTNDQRVLALIMDDMADEPRKPNMRDRLVPLLYGRHMTPVNK